MDEDTLSLVEGLGYEYRRGINFDVIQRPGSPFKIGLETTAEDTTLPYIQVRTSSWSWPGERSDLNDVLSVLFAVSLRCASATSCRFIEVPNEFSRIAGELYARFLLPQQPFATGYTDGDNACDDLQGLIASMFWAEQSSGMILQSCGASDDTEGSCNADGAALTSWVGDIEHLLRRQDPEATYNSRIDPTWWYYRTSTGITIVRSNDLAAGLAFLGRPRDGQPTQCVRTPQGLLIRDRGICNYIPAALRRKIRRILSGLGEPRTEEPTIVALENHTVATAGSHSIFLQSNTGRREFDRQVQALRSRNAAETNFLFADTSLVWKYRVPGHRFQLLVTDLLRREPGVSHVRPVGAATEGDGGRDYLIDWTTPLLPGEVAVEDAAPSRL